MDRLAGAVVVVVQAAFLRMLAERNWRFPWELRTPSSLALVEPGQLIQMQEFRELDLHLVQLRQQEVAAAQQIQLPERRQPEALEAVAQAQAAEVALPEIPHQLVRRKELAEETDRKPEAALLGKWQRVAAAAILRQAQTALPEQQAAMAAQAQAAASAEAQSIMQAAAAAVTGTKVRQLVSPVELAVLAAVAMVAEALQHRQQAL